MSQIKVFISTNILTHNFPADTKGKGRVNSVQRYNIPFKYVNYNCTCK